MYTYGSTSIKYNEAKLIYTLRSLGNDYPLGNVITKLLQSSTEVAYRELVTFHVLIRQKLIELYTYGMCIWLYVYYTSIKM